MYKKLSYVFMFICFFILPICTFALTDEETDFYTISETKKYYKTIEYLDNSSSIVTFSLNNNRSVTYEITKEEYDAVNNNNGFTTLSSTVVNTAYKEMTTSISSNGKVYRYKNVLNWKQMPATRSYDIIGIGYLGSVKASSNIYFNQRYCTSLTNCTTTTTGTIQRFQSGVGVSFQLPTGNISTLTQTLYFDVEKNTSETIVKQTAYGDYSHATSVISSSNAKKYDVSGSGILLNTSIVDYYDEINYARVTWSGSW